MPKKYLVQTWGDDGALTNNYLVTVESPTQLRELNKFLKTKNAHVAITPESKPRLTQAPAKKRR